MGTGNEVGRRGDGPDVLTTEEVAELLRISVHVVRREVRAGRLPARRVGKEYRFSRRAVLGWLESGEGDQRYRRGARNDSPPPSL